MEDALVAAHAAGAAEGVGCYVLGAVGGGEGVVGFPAGPGWVGGELLDDGEAGGLGVEVGDDVFVLVGVGGRRGRGGDEEAEG